MDYNNVLKGILGVLGVINMITAMVHKYKLKEDNNALWDLGWAILDYVLILTL